MIKKFLKLVIYTVIGLVLILGIGGYLFVRNFDLNQYKSYVEEIAAKELGRKLTINGNASIGISLIPTLVVEDVELANAAWASQPQMVKVQSLDVQLSLLPLLHKQIVVNKLLLVQPQIYLEKAKDGKANWDFMPQAQTVAEGLLRPVAESFRFELIGNAYAESDGAVSAEAAIKELTLKNVSIENGVVQYTDQKSGSVTNLAINSFNLEEYGMNDDIAVKFDVVFNGQNINGTADLGSINAFLNSKNPYPFNVAVAAYGADLSAVGTVRDVMGGNPSYAADVNLYNPGGNLGAPETTLKTHVTGDTKQIKADIALLNIVNNLITGQVKANLAGKIPAINADLNSDKINLQNFSSNNNFAFVLPSLISSAEASQLVPATLVPYGEMTKINALVNLNIKKLIIEPGMEADNVVATANLQNGVLNVNPLRLNFGGGDVVGNLSVNANNQSVALNLNSSNVLLQNLHKEFQVSGNGDFGIVSGGNTDLKIAVTATGATYRQLAQSLNGQVIAIVNKSVVQTGNVSFFTGNFLSQLLNVLPFAQNSNQQLDLQCAVVRADLANGMAVFPKGIAVDATQMKLVSNGSINLVNDKIDFSIRPFSGKVVDTNVAQALSSFINVKGTLENPKIALDEKAALRSVVGVALTGPAYLGSKLVLDADPAPCYTALKGTSFQNKFPEPTAAQAASQDVYNGANDAVDDSVKVVKGTAKELENTAKDIINIFRNPKGF